MDTVSLNEDILQHSSVMLGILDGDGRLTATNATWSENLGFPPTLLKESRTAGIQIYEHLHPEDNEVIRNYIEQLMSDSDPADSFSFSNRVKDTQGAYHRIHWEIWKNSDTNVIQVVAVDLGKLDTIDSPILLPDMLNPSTERALPAEGDRRRHDRRRDVVELKANQTRYMLAVSAGKTGVWDWDLQGERFHFDHNLKALLGYTDDEIPNTLQAWYAMVHPDDRDKVQTQIQGIIRGKISELEVDRRMLHKDGSIRWFVARATILRDEDGVAYRLVGIDTDISDRKQIGLILQSRDKLLRATSQAAQQLLTLPDYNTALQQVLTTLGDATGVDRITIFAHEKQPGIAEHQATPIFTWAGERLSQRNLPKAYETIVYNNEKEIPDWYRELAKNRPVTEQTRLLPTNERKLLEGMGVKSILLIPLYVKPQFRHYMAFDDCNEEREWADHEISLLQVFGDSIRACMARQRVEDARRLSEQRRQEQMERNHMITEAAMDGFCVSSVDGRIIEVNPAFCSMLGYANESELMFAGFVTLAAQEQQPKLKQHIELTVQNGAHRFETQMQDKHGNSVDVDISSHVVRFSEKAGDGLFFSFLRDIRERKQTEREMRQAKLDVEQAARAKAEFLTTMNHELHTPMSGIIGTAELLLRTPLNLQQQHYVEMLFASAKSLLNIIQDILEFSRTESSRMDLEISDFNLHELVENTFNLFVSTIHEKGVEYICHLPPDLPLLLRGDPARLRQILVSLISNAVKFTDSGEV
ncbi:MAG: PAS domain S-box protein, partial [Pseudomonadota bacterium]